MTESEAKGFVQGKLDCMKECDVFNKEDKHRNNECDNCEYCYSQGNFGEQKEAFQMAINALEEIQQYKALGTVEELRLAKEKQTPKKPIFTEDKQFALCPCCDMKGLIDKQKYCDNCGKKLDWSDE